MYKLVTRLLWGAAVLLALGVGGCSEQTATENPPPSGVNRVQLEGMRFSDWQAFLRRQPPSIVVVDFWATWCGPCLERFPHMVAMEQAYRSADVKFVSMLLEDPEDDQAFTFAREFLAGQQAPFQHYWLNENLLQSFELLDLISVPAVFIYDRSGQLSHRLTGDDPNRQFTEQDIEAALQELLKDPAKQQASGNR